jgi:hypothetical protein
VADRQPFSSDELAAAFGPDVSSYTVTALDPELRFHSVTGGVFRVTGDDRSVVVKVVRRGHDDDPGALWVAGAEPTHRNYWKREWLAYDSGLLASLPGELTAPRVLATMPRSDTECLVWMSDVEGRSGADWPVEDYDSAAFDLGTTQGAYAAGTAELPDHPWLSRQWLRGWVATCAPTLDTLADDRLCADDRLAPLLPLRERVAALWQAREELLALVESAPQTVVHLDLWPPNLIAADDGTTVAIDWSQMGIGAIGQDLDQLTLDPVWMQLLPELDLDVLDAHVVPAYLAGLRAAGMEVAEEELRRWHGAAAGARYPWLAARMIAASAEPAEVRRLETRWGRPFPALVADRSRVIERALQLGEQALA